MKILVTGATGFVGACLARRLIKKGHDVHIFTRSGSNKWRVSDILGQMIEHEVDLRDAESTQSAILKIRPNMVYHLATYGGFSFQSGTQTIIESNFTGTVNLLQACEKIDFDYFVNTGSSSEYGIKQYPIAESDILQPIGDYGVSKAAASLYCQSEAIQKDLPVITLRLFSPYGNWDDPNRLIPYVIKSFLRGQVPKLSTPNSVRDYIFIEDVLDFYENITKKSIHPGEFFNVGSGVQSSIGEVVACIKAILASNVEPSWGSMSIKRSEPSVWVADTSKVQLMGFNENVSLKEGLEKTTVWMKEHLDLYP